MVQAHSAATSTARIDPDQDFLAHAEAMQFGDIHMRVNAECQLRAIIAIHNTRLGPALGGTRCVPYSSTAAAIGDAMRLAHGMSYKAAVADIPHGGGKAVLMRPEKITDREAYFEAYGDFIETLGGRFITAVDSGTTVDDMDIIARRTRHVGARSNSTGGSGDPSPSTAHGVLRGIEAAVHFRLGRDDLRDIRVNVQGVGQVGHSLVRELRERGANVTVCDINARNVARCVDQLGCKSVDIGAIAGQPGDVFAPCALGGVLNDDTVARLQVSIVAGAANNQLARDDHAQRLHERDIVYAPDYVINAGGLTHVVFGETGETAARVERIRETLQDIFERARTAQVSPLDIANRLAESKLYGDSKNSPPEEGIA
ncbi:MAG: Leu/Phe/Val dehydrogenase [Gammaproteobacteria bacterium]